MIYLSCSGNLLEFENLRINRKRCRITFKFCAEIFVVVARSEIAFKNIVLNINQSSYVIRIR